MEYGEADKQHIDDEHEGNINKRLDGCIIPKIIKMILVYFIERLFFFI